MLDGILQQTVVAQLSHQYFFLKHVLLVMDSLDPERGAK
jgi:hypothetical protein